MDAEVSFPREKGTAGSPQSRPFLLEQQMFFYRPPGMKPDGRLPSFRFRLLSRAAARSMVACFVYRILSPRSPSRLKWSQDGAPTGARTLFIPAKSGSAAIGHSLREAEWHCRLPVFPRFMRRHCGGGRAAFIIGGKAGWVWPQPFSSSRPTLSVYQKQRGDSMICVIKILYLILMECLFFPADLFF